LHQYRRFSPVRSVIAFVVLALIGLFSGCASVSPPSDTSASQDVTPISPIDTAGTTPVVEFSSDFAADSAPRPDDTNLWDRIRTGFAMPELESPLVAEKEKFYLARRDYLNRMFERSGRYLFYIVEEIERRGMPAELALLPFVESAMNPTALSSAQAAGLWQFIPSTGKAYDLQQNWWVDNRRDVVKSTQAALDYLQKIYEMQGNDWFLALASYNWGEGAVARAVKRNESRGKPADYLSLRMPAETRHYVPKLMALKNIIVNAEQLGVELPFVPNRPYFVTIEKTRPIDLKLAAQFAGMTEEEFVALNPAHNRPVIAASKNNEIRLPADRVDDFTEAVERHAQAQKTFASWQPYTLKPGESIESLAKEAGISPKEIRQANGIHARQQILAGTRLLAPHKDVEDETRVEQFVAPRVYERVERPARYHTVGRKESLASIARRYGISASAIAAWNGLQKDVQRGMRLLVQPASTQTLLTKEDGRRQVISVKNHGTPSSTAGAKAPVKAKTGSKTKAKTNPRTSRKSRQAASTAKPSGAQENRGNDNKAGGLRTSEPTQRGESSAKKAPRT
jgi:membrane-bound lytic murein transglycosylase D